MSDVEARLKVLEDIEAIKQLKAFYCYSVDNGEIDALLQRFTEHAVWDGGTFGRYVGRAKIGRFLSNLPSHLKFYLHWVVNPLIEIDGDTATGAWYLIEPNTTNEDQAIWGAGRYDEIYVRRNGVWMIHELKLTTIFWSPYATGWAADQQQ